MAMSSEEKSIWIQLVAMLASLGLYFVLAGRMLAAGQRELGAFLTLFLLAVGLMVVMLIVSYALSAIFSRVDAPDERDRLIAWKAEYRSAWLTSVGVLAGVVCIALGVHAVWVANLLLLSLTLSEVLGYVLQLRSYRRGV
jgi:uncharacterized membrane protein YfcA